MTEAHALSNYGMILDKNSKSKNNNHYERNLITLTKPIDNNVYVVWQGFQHQKDIPDKYDIYFTASHDNGQNFTNPLKLSNNTISYYPDISSSIS